MTVNSEAEFERLYQEFVRAGGGKYTFDPTDFTPAEYYDLVETTELSEADRNALIEAQEQYNRQSALNTIQTELLANNFTNPMLPLVDEGRAAFASLEADPGVIAVTQLNDAIQASPDREIILEYFGTIGTDPTTGTASTNFLNVGGTSGLYALANPMYDQLVAHTNTQVADLPQTLSDVQALTSMQQQFNEKETQSCSIFNQLMGLLAGAFDPALNFLSKITDTIKQFLAPFINMFNTIKNAILSGVNAIIGTIQGIIGTALGALQKAMSAVNNIIGQVTGIIGKIVGQIANEIAGLANMAASLLAYAQAIALAAGAFDICQLAVLLRTAGPAMKGALSLLTAPISSSIPTVPTSIDPRANSAVVQSALAVAQQTAATSPGVPQSPMTAAAKKYQPLDAYLHSTIQQISGVIAGTLQTITAATGISNVVQSFTQNALGSLAGSSTSDVSTGLGSISTVKSDSFNAFSQTYLNPLLKRRTELKNTRLQINEELTTNSVLYTPAQITQGKIFIEELQKSEIAISSLLTSNSDKLIYQSVDGRRDESKEADLKQSYGAISQKMDLALTSSGRVRDISGSWLKSVQ